MNTDNLDYLINLEYEYFYLKNSDKCFDTTNIELDDIDAISNIKLIPQADKINTYINQIFNTNVNYIEKYEDEYSFIRIGPINSTITIKLYQSEETKNDLTSEDNNGKTISFLLSDFVTKKQTKHILLPIFNIDLPVKRLIPFLSKYPELEKIQNATNKILSVSITERFFKMMSLDEYLNKHQEKINSEFILSTIWQVVHTLAIIRQKYPDFNHNLLNTESIFVYIIENNTHESKYQYDNQEFTVPNNGINIKIGNFKLAEIKSDNSDDIKTFINSLINNNSINEYLKNNSEIKKIIIEYINMKPEQ